MVKHLCVVFLFVIHALAVHAQSKVTVGKPYAVIDAESKYYFTNNGEILTVKIHKRAITLQKMNAVNLSFQKIKLYDDFPKDFQLEKITEFKDRYYFFYSLWENEEEQLFCREIDFASCSFKGPGKKVITVKEEISGSLVRAGMWRMALSDKFDFFFSYDSTSLVIQYRLKPEKRNDSKNYDVIGMHVFDKNLKEKWSNRIKMPYTEKKMDNLDYSVDSKGNVYIVTRVFNDNTTDEKKRGDDDANYHLEILKVATSSGAITTTKVDVADKFVQTIWLYESAQGHMICAGFYNTGKNMDNVDGVILFKFSPDGKLFDLNSYEIPVEILNQYASGKTKRKNDRKDDDDKAEFENLDLQHVEVQKDGSIVLVSEQKYIRTHTTYTNGRSNTYYTYHCNDIFITKINASGKLAWMKKLPKRQEGGAGFGGMSYCYFISDKNHYMIFLDNEKNMDLPLTEVPARHVDGAGGFLTAYKINDASGAVEKVSLLNTRDVNGIEVFQFAPHRIMATDVNTLVFEAYKKKKEDILVKIVLED
ncbi:hypothetical protein [Ohtaekwangia koreensis]|uniref:WD40-like Beta Propeller Repeat n=1 Tax=Ohtaekwangia koreensis TaxID=688867 RepID=A0A1T5LAR5_9BACT|nr:hypothetical protein [Ohtaekwangia koreensis]SKC72765.1 hypothetical protein SAMN05660236_2809 [Ohtaekwangia koreensis]